MRFSLSFHKAFNSIIIVCQMFIIIGFQNRFYVQWVILLRGGFHFCNYLDCFHSLLSHYPLLLLSPLSRCKSLFNSANHQLVLKLQLSSHYCDIITLENVTAHLLEAALFLFLPVKQGRSLIALSSSKKDWPAWKYSGFGVLALPIPASR